MKAEIGRRIALSSMSLWLSGCMMIGMSGMGMGAGTHRSAAGLKPRRLTVVKESVADGRRMTVEVPPFTLGDTLEYTVTLQDARSRAGVSGASMVLLISPVAVPAHDATSESERAHTAHDASPSATRDTAHGDMEFAADEASGGRYVFHPSLAVAGSYRFRFVLTRIGTRGLDPPDDLELVVQLADADTGHMAMSAPSMGAKLTPLIVLGALAMGVAMAVMFR
jgi:hypothetical protein